MKLKPKQRMWAVDKKGNVKRAYTGGEPLVYVVEKVEESHFKVYNLGTFKAPCNFSLTTGEALLGTKASELYKLWSNWKLVPEGSL